MVWKMKNNNSKKHYAVITGASSGIGAEFAMQLAKEGYQLILIARRTERLQKLADRLKKHGILCEILTADLSITEEVYRVGEYINKKEVDIFINNAGFGDCGYFPDTNLEKEMEMIDVNVKALHMLMKIVLVQFQKQDYGYLLNVASSAGLFPGGPYMATYYATKAYVTSITQAVAKELSDHNSKVYVGCLCPGPVATEFNQKANVKFSLKEITARKCVTYAIMGMKKRKVVIIPTISLKLAIFGGRFISRAFNLSLVGYQQKKKFGK